MSDAILQIRDMRHRMASDLALLALALERRGRSRVSTTGETIDDAVDSVLTLAAHYRQLYELGGRRDFIDLPDYIGALGQGLRKAYLDRLGVQLDCQSVDIADVAVPPAAASAIGCILMEVIANAAKHAFGPDGGRITVTLSNTDSVLACTVVDDGCGRDHRRTDLGFSGLQLAAQRAANLGGRLDIRARPGGPGLAVALTIPDRRRSPVPHIRPH
jgi:two-component sensor histidine kinase